MTRKERGTPLTVSYFLDRSVTEPNSGCWLWDGAIDARHGYGAIRYKRKTARAHRKSYEIANNCSVLPGVDVCHRCDVRCCVNPDHLFVGTRADNMRDCSRKGRIKIPGFAGEQLPQAVLKESQVIAIRLSTQSQRSLARQYGVDKGTIAQIIHRKTWRHI